MFRVEFVEVVWDGWMDGWMDGKGVEGMGFSFGRLGSGVMRN